MSTTLGIRALNRALLHRQSLSSRSTLAPLAMVERLVGMQAQAPFPPYFGLWSRLVDFGPDQLSLLIRDRQVVRIVLMRGTIHLVSARDCLLLRPLVQPALVRTLGSSSYARHLVGLDPAELADAGRAALADGPLSPAELGARLAQRWPDRDPSSLTNAVRTHVPLVQVPPRALWGRTGLARHATAESWLGAALESAPVIDDVVCRYLAAFGPASVRDVQNWSGLTRLGEVVARLRPGLVVFRDEHGVELFDLPDAERPDPDTPAPVRLVAPFDNLTLAHADRSRILSAEHRRRLATMNGIVPGMLLVDGFVAGSWRLERGRDRAELLIEPFERLASDVRADVVDEGERLLAFAAPEADGEVRV